MLKKLKKSKKAQTGNLFDLVLQLVLIGMILGVGLVVLGKPIEFNNNSSDLYLRSPAESPQTQAPQSTKQ